MKNDVKLKFGWGEPAQFVYQFSDVVPAVGDLVRVNHKGTTGSVLLETPWLVVETRSIEYVGVGDYMRVEACLWCKPVAA